MSYEIMNATRQEQTVIKNIIEFIGRNYGGKVDIRKLHIIEVVNGLDNDSSGRSMKDKIILPRKFGLEGVKWEGVISHLESTDQQLKMLIGTVYHELWHITTWEKYESMYQYVLEEKSEDIYLVYAYMYWIEYIAHIETVFMEIDEIMKVFCNNFVQKNWHKIDCGYSYFIKGLPYYLVRANHLNVFDELTKKIKCRELREATYDFDSESKQLFNNKKYTDIEKAQIIREKIKCLFE